MGDQIMINIGEITSNNEPESDSNLGGIYLLRVTVLSHVTVTKDGVWIGNWIY
jgi:hypothetical protein